MKPVTLLLMSIVLSAGAACATFNPLSYQNPVVTVRDVQVSQIGLTGGTVDVVLNVYNPNHFKLDATRITYKLMVDSVTFGSGASDSRFTVQSGDSLQVPLPLTFSWNGVGTAGRQLMNSGKVNYRVLGDVTVGASVGTFTIPYDRTGTFTAFSGSGR
ncbi:MAG TPA: LEA type 2 family protein [Gemmatimonadaceae bacterium]|jgi:LEA14-like dessication related protein|nr:LEA type 2 family protein [Gemmatimonadaceae bacterium]